jgi:hypothetical protein
MIVPERESRIMSNPSLSLTAHRPGATYRGTVVPYITSWSSERPARRKVIVRPLSGIGFLDEVPADRDEHGVLWRRMSSSPGVGQPEFGSIHSPRQREAMRDLLCQVCGGPADQTAEGTLWLLKDHRGDWADWPHRMGVTEPPICLPCAQIARDACPALRREGHVALRVTGCPVSGISGALYRAGAVYPSATATGIVIVAFDDPAVRWIQAVHLVREITRCTIVDLDTQQPSAEQGDQTEIT